MLQGTAPIVLFHTLEAISACMDIYNFLETYFQKFQFPKAWKVSHVHSLFTKKRVEKFKKASKFSCLESEFLAVFPIVRHLIHVVPEPQHFCTEACQAFCTMAEIIDQCHGGALCKTTTRDSLLQAIEAGNQAFAHAFPNVGMIKKWHWHLHLPGSYARYGHLSSCFNCERKHKTISSYATRLQHTQGYEINLLQQVVSNEILSLQQEGVFPNEATLVKPRKATQKQREMISIFLLQPCEDAQSSTPCVPDLPKEGRFSMKMSFFTRKVRNGELDKSNSTCKSMASKQLWSRCGRSKNTTWTSNMSSAMSPANLVLFP